MFFSPLLTYLAKNNFNIFVGCLSNGNFNGLGKIREKELIDALRTVWNVSPKNIQIINDEINMPDNIKKYWNNDIIVNYINQWIKKWNIDTIFTFDKYGISMHPNHKSISIAINTALTQKQQKQQKNGSNKENTDKQYLENVEIYQLTTHGILRKYSSLIESLYVYLTTTNNLSVKKIELNDELIVLGSPMKSYYGMKCHKSQFVWFRRLFVVFSQYCWINRSQRIN